VTNLRREAGVPIGEALLDQRNLAGIGNLYKAEALFLRGVDPWTPVGDVPDLPALVTLAQRLIAANRDHPAQVTTGDARPGRDHWVYGRAGRACRRCGTPVRSAEQAEPEQPAYGRLTYWCPHCQPGPGPGAAAGPAPARSGGQRGARGAPSARTARDGGGDRGHGGVGQRDGGGRGRDDRLR
jgi:endonuclease-8